MTIFDNVSRETHTLTVTIDGTKTVHTYTDYGATLNARVKFKRQVKQTFTVVYTDAHGKVFPTDTVYRKYMTAPNEDSRGQYLWMSYRGIYRDDNGQEFHAYKPDGFAMGVWWRLEPVDGGRVHFSYDPGNGLKVEKRQPSEDRKIIVRNYVLEPYKTIGGNTSLNVYRVGDTFSQQCTHYGDGEVSFPYPDRVPALIKRRISSMLRRVTAAP